jgi:SecD/SecF fusion protein
MKNNFWRLMLVLFVLVWSIVELTPPTDRDLIQEFDDRASSKDAAFAAIVTQARSIQATNSVSIFGNLRTAVGTNDLRKYFTSIDVSAERDANRAILNRLQRDVAGKIKLGLDIRGGTEFLVALDTDKLSAGIDKAGAVSQAIEVLRKRVDKFGVAEPVLQPAGENRILIQIPGLTEADKENAKINLKKTAFLEFRMVHPDSDRQLADGLLVPGYEKLAEKRVERDEKAGTTQERLIYLLVEKQARLKGSEVKRAYVSLNSVNGSPEINFELNDGGAKIFAELTRTNIDKRLAIVIDGEVASAPFIRGEIPGGRGQITGNYDIREATLLANVLENPLQAPIIFLSERGVDPSLGIDAVKSGILASIIGTIAVSLFMLVYYRVAGLVANIALLANIVILLGVMCSVGTTLTLPGIAGIVLTVGMAVDANVLIYERIREELAAGKSLRGAIAAGYDKAFSTIFDSHVTTLISSIILIYMGTGTIKGFGVALTIGVAASLFTALVVTRLIFDFMLSRDWLKTVSMLHIIKSVNLDFMKLAKPAFALSWAIIIVGVAYGVFVRGHRVLGVDFVGGDNLTMKFVEKVPSDQVRKALTQAGVVEPTIQYQKEIATGTQTLSIRTSIDEGEKAQGILQKSFPNAKFERLGLDKVGPTIGKEIQNMAYQAMLWSLLGILVYVAFRYEFSFAVGAVVAILHDVLMTIGCYCLSGREFNAPTVAALLTIIGFSINDTVVIFDRIREDLKLGVRGTFKELINKALNQTLSRTIITSGTVLLATLSLYIFGGGAVNDFAFTFLVGIITGTYSSIYIASALVLWWHKGERPKNAPSSTVAVESAASSARVG